MFGFWFGQVGAAEKDAGLSLNSPPVPAPKYPPIQESHSNIYSLTTHLSFNITNIVADKLFVVIYISVNPRCILLLSLLLFILSHHADSHRFSHAAGLEDDWESQKSRHDQMSVSQEAESEQLFTCFLCHLI